LINEVKNLKKKLSCFENLNKKQEETNIEKFQNIDLSFNNTLFIDKDISFNNSNFYFNNVTRINRMQEVILYNPTTINPDTVTIDFLINPINGVFFVSASSNTSGIIGITINLTNFIYNNANSNTLTLIFYNETSSNIVYGNSITISNSSVVSTIPIIPFLANANKAPSIPSITNATYLVQSLCIIYNETTSTTQILTNITGYM